MESPTSAQRLHAVGGLGGKCGYCNRTLLSVTFIYERVRPACGSAWCLRQALDESERSLPRAA